MSGNANADSTAGKKRFSRVRGLGLWLTGGGAKKKGADFVIPPKEGGSLRGEGEMGLISNPIYERKG